MNYDLEQDIRSASKAGFEAVEIWVRKLDKYLEKKDIKDLKDEIDSLKLKVASLCPYGLSAFGEQREANIQTIKEAAITASKLGCPVLLVCPDVPPPGMSSGEAFKLAGQTARKLGEVCGEYGVKVALEPLGGHPFVPGAKEAMKIVEQADHPGVGIMMDTFHYYKSGVLIEDIAKIPIDRLLIVHVNDCEDRPKEELNDGHRLYTGLGVIPLREMLGTIKRNGYTGYLSVEIFRKEYWEEDPDTISLKAKQHLDNVLKQIL